MRISDWSSDVCSSDLAAGQGDGKIAFSNAGSIGAVDKAGAVTDTVGVLLNGSSAEADNTLAAGNAGLITGGFSATGFGGTVTLDNRSEDRRVGKGCVSTLRSRWSALP